MDGSLKRVLIAARDRLVAAHGFARTKQHAAHECESPDRAARSYAGEVFPLELFLEWANRTPEFWAVLAEHGGCWADPTAPVSGSAPVVHPLSPIPAPPAATPLTRDATGKVVIPPASPGGPAVRLLGEPQTPGSGPWLVTGEYAGDMVRVERTLPSGAVSIKVVKRAEIVPAPPPPVVGRRRPPG